VLNALVTILKDNPAISVELSSHTDSYGPDWYNNRLSQQRAQNCVNYIISKGISRNRIIAKGYGASKPMVPNKLPDGRDDPAGRRQNRRTEFKVLSDE
jgi:OOP family OmpA-OmpF porin